MTAQIKNIMTMASMVALNQSEQTLTIETIMDVTESFRGWNALTAAAASPRPETYASIETFASSTKKSIRTTRIKGERIHSDSQASITTHLIGWAFIGLVSTLVAVLYRSNSER